MSGDFNGATLTDLLFWPGVALVASSLVVGFLYWRSR